MIAKFRRFLIFSHAGRICQTRPAIFRAGIVFPLRRMPHYGMSTDKHDHHIVGAKEKLAHAHKAEVEQQQAQKVASSLSWGLPGWLRSGDPRKMVSTLVILFVLASGYWLYVVASHWPLRTTHGHVLAVDSGTITIAYMVADRPYKITEIVYGRRGYYGRRSYYSSQPSYNVGETVSVLYDPAHPQIGHRNTYDWLIPALGTLFAGLGLGEILLPSRGEAFAKALLALRVAVGLGCFIVMFFSIYQMFHYRTLH
jgi:hypothetical protein